MKVKSGGDHGSIWNMARTTKKDPDLVDPALLAGLRSLRRRSAAVRSAIKRLKLSREDAERLELLLTSALEDVFDDGYQVGYHQRRQEKG